MNTRPITDKDIGTLIEIHKRYYAHQFDFPNFLGKFIYPMAITDDKNRIITAGGIVPIAEVIILTDKSQSIIARIDALQEMLAKTRQIAGLYGYSRLHAFVHDPTWKSQLIKAGFESCPGEILSIGVH
jgi:hypothetical protein